MNAVLEDMDGSVDVLAWPEAYERTRELWEVGQILIIGGKVRARGDGVSLVCDAVKPYQPGAIAEEASEENTATLPPKSLEQLIEVASELLAHDLDCVWKSDDSRHEYYWVDRAGGVPATKQEISTQLDINEEEASIEHSPTRMSHFRIHLEQEVKAEYPELSSKDYSAIWADHPYEIIDTLRLLVERGTFRSTCPICKPS